MKDRLVIEAQEKILRMDWKVREDFMKAEEQERILKGLKEETPWWNWLAALMGWSSGDTGASERVGVGMVGLEKWDWSPKDLNRWYDKIEEEMGATNDEDQKVAMGKVLNCFWDYNGSLLGRIRIRQRKWEWDQEDWVGLKKIEEKVLEKNVKDAIEWKRRLWQKMLHNDEIEGLKSWNEQGWLKDWGDCWASEATVAGSKHDFWYAGIMVGEARAGVSWMEEKVIRWSPALLVTLSGAKQCKDWIESYKPEWKGFERKDIERYRKIKKGEYETGEEVVKITKSMLDIGKLSGKKIKNVIREIIKLDENLLMEEGVFWSHQKIKNSEEQWNKIDVSWLKKSVDWGFTSNLERDKNIGYYWNMYSEKDRSEWVEELWEILNLSHINGEKEWERLLRLSLDEKEKKTAWQVKEIEKLKAEIERKILRENLERKTEGDNKTSVKRI